MYKIVCQPGFTIALTAIPTTISTIITSISTVVSTSITAQDCYTNVGWVEAEDKYPEVQPQVQPEVLVYVQDGPVVAEQVDSEVHGARIRQLVIPIQLRRGLRSQITLGEEII